MEVTIIVTNFDPLTSSAVNKSWVAIYIKDKNNDANQLEWELNVSVEE